MKVNLTKDDAQECQHKLGVLCDTPDLQDDYGLTQAQCEELVASVPNSGEWIIPTFGVKAVLGEMSDHANVLRDIARSCRSEAIGQSLSMHKQAGKFEAMFNQATPAAK